MEGWAERVCELEEEMRRCQVAHSAMLQDVANKDERIMVDDFTPFISDFDPSSSDGCFSNCLFTVLVPHRSPAGHESFGFRR